MFEANEQEKPIEEEGLTSGKEVGDRLVEVRDRLVDACMEAVNAHDKNKATNSAHVNEGIDPVNISSYKNIDLRIERSGGLQIKR